MKSSYQHQSAPFVSDPTAGLPGQAGKPGVLCIAPVTHTHRHISHAEMNYMRRFSALAELKQH